MTVKGNQPTLLNDISSCFENQVQPHFETFDKGHGRLEIRKIWCSSAIKGFVDFPCAEQGFRIDREITHIKQKKTTHETVYGISSLNEVQAKPDDMLAYVRGHWSIENKLHYVRDTTFDEDRCRIRSAKGQRVMASLRNLVIGLIRLKNNKANIASILRCNSMKPHSALALMGV